MVADNGPNSGRTADSDGTRLDVLELRKMIRRTARQRQAAAERRQVRMMTERWMADDDGMEDDGKDGTVTES